jgi:hypothetical protein
MMHFFAKKTACLAIVTGTRFVQLFPSPVLYKGELPASTVPRELPGNRYAHQEY